MLWLLIVALVSFVYSFWSGALNLREGRRPIGVEGPRLSWEEAPRSILWQDSRVGMLIIVHSVSVFIMAVVGLQVGLRAWDTPSLTLNLPVQLMFYGALTLSIFYIWRVAGIALVYPLLNGRIGPVPIHLLQSGIQHGRFRIQWDKVGWVDSIPGSRGLHLRSKRNREITLISLLPETDAHLEKVTAILADHIKKPLALKELPWLERKSTFGLLFLATIIPFLLAGFLVSLMDLDWAFVYFSLAAYMVSRLGARVLRYYFS